MTEGRLKLALIFGGRSAEHEVSLRSARSIFEAADKTRYHLMPILMTKEGASYRRPPEAASFDPEPALDESDRIVLSPDPAHKGFLLIAAGERMEPLEVDAVFPVIHGTYGEDGTLQGLFDLANLPYVGCGVLASSMGMDKVIVKSAFRDAGLEVGPFFWFLRSYWKEHRGNILERLEKSEFPLFVKPANLGSSVGISRVTNVVEFEAAVELAASYDRKILVEDGIPGRELEVGVMGNDEVSASVPGEIVSKSDFYDYDEKYLDDTAELIIPADLPPRIVDLARAYAVTAFQTVDGSGLARVDMFLTPDDRIVINEINTLPGFTSISMYPKLWEESGIPYGELIDKLVDLALQRHEERASILTRRDPP